MCPIYEVVSSEDPTRGRYVLALRDIKAGEIVVKDEPFVVVPSMKSLPVCIQCFKSYAMKEIPKCDSCGFPLCEEKEECDSLKLFDHKKEECEVLSKIGAKPIFVNNTISPLYMAIGPLRLLLKSRKDPESYKKHIKSLMGHVDASRNIDTKSCMMNQVIVVGFMQKTLGLSDFSAQQIHEVIGIIKTNSVKLDSKKGHLVGMAIYPDYSLFNHSCVANTKTRKKADGTLELFAISDIAKGEEIFTRNDYYF
ncbi:histone-lysine N-methyltransferase Smyd1 [Lepeophtheirus salmonis]|uniref:histone-lysine N-methyltransferase Smyd1 n=1 Tax=Lepeophtheirus salmonis TaxID=72036 RepID=UPI003AF3B19F